MPNIGFRMIEATDRDFLYTVYASTRTAELSKVDWSDKQKAEFLEMQFSAQHSYYQQHYSDADFFVILIDKQPAGRLYRVEWPNEIRIVDFSLLPQYRNAGIGTKILQNELDTAATVGKPVRIHVECFNPALRLYQRLGFIHLSENGVYYLMEWSPASL